MQNVKTKRRIARIMRKAVGYSILVPLSALTATPMFWALSTALKSNADMTKWPPAWFPAQPEWQNFLAGFRGAHAELYFVNTMAITTLALIGTLLTASMTAYGFARLRFPGRDLLFGLVVATMLLPGVVTMIPTFILFKTLGWLNTWRPLIVPAYFGGGAFSIFLLRQNFLTLPNELFEQAKIDGASDFRTYWQITMPLAKAPISTIFVFTFMFHWNDFAGPLIYLNNPAKFPLTLGLQRFATTPGVRAQEVMALSILLTIPVIIVFFMAQQYAIRGIVLTGSIKA